MISINLANVTVILTNGYCLFFGHSCFRKKTFRVFRGCNRRQCEQRYVPFWGILIFNLNVLPLLGDATKYFSGVLMSQNRGFSFSKKRFCRIWDNKWPVLAKNRPKMQKYLCRCPFLGHSYFQLKCFAVFGGSEIILFFHTFCTMKIMTHIMLTKINKNRPCQICQILSFVIIFVII